MKIFILLSFIHSFTIFSFLFLILRRMDKQKAGISYNSTYKMHTVCQFNQTLPLQQQQ